MAHDESRHVQRRAAPRARQARPARHHDPRGRRRRRPRRDRRVHRPRRARVRRPGLHARLPRARAAVRQQLLLGRQRRASASATCRSVLTGESIGAMGMTEPAVGTDVLGMQTTARRDGDHYILNGRKTFITNGPECRRRSLVYAKLDDRITTFVVERAFPASRPSPKIPKMGMRASTMSELIFDDCRVPAREPARHRGRRHHEHDAQPRDRAARPRRR